LEKEFTGSEKDREYVRFAADSLVRSALASYALSIPGFIRWSIRRPAPMLANRC
jgi:hypothetical protein